MSYPGDAVKQRVMLATIVLAMLALMGWSYARLCESRDSANLAGQDLADCRALAGRIEGLRRRPAIAAGQALGDVELSRRIDAAAQAAEFPDGAIGRISPQRQRIGETNYLEVQTQVRLQKVTLQQLFTFLHVLSVDPQGSPGTSAALQVRAINLSAPRDDELGEPLDGGRDVEQYGFRAKGVGRRAARAGVRMEDGGSYSDVGCVGGLRGAMRYDISVLPTFLALACALLLTGCSGASRQAASPYETVGKDPHRDADLAQRENARAVALIDAGNYTAAETALKAALAADVMCGPAHNNLGKVYYHESRLYLAAWEFQYALKLMPNQPEPLNNLGLVFEAAGKLDEAADHYGKAIALEPDNIHAMGNLARACVRRGDHDADLIALLNRLILRDTRTDWLAWKRAHAFAIRSSYCRVTKRLDGTFISSHRHASSADKWMWCGHCRRRERIIKICAVPFHI